MSLSKLNMAVTDARLNYCEAIANSLKALQKGQPLKPHSDIEVVMLDLLQAAIWRLEVAQLGAGEMASDLVEINGEAA